MVKKQNNIIIFVIIGAILIGIFSQQGKKEAGETVNFRTTGLKYASTTSIAFTTSCGNSLVPYGFVSSTGNSSGLCSAVMPTTTQCGGTGTTNLMNDLPGGFQTGGANPSLWQSIGTPTMVCVCDDNGIIYTFKRYDSTYPSTIDTSITLIDPTKEIICGV